MPAWANASASRWALPLGPGSSGEFQSRSVGPLPATMTTAGNGPAPDGLTTVPSMVVASSGQLISALSSGAACSVIAHAPSVVAIVALACGNGDWQRILSGRDWAVIVRTV